MIDTNVIALVAMVVVTVWGLGFLAAIIALTAILYKEGKVAKEATKVLGRLAPSLAATATASMHDKAVSNKQPISPLP